MKSFLKSSIKNRLFFLYTTALLLLLFSAVTGLLTGSTRLTFNDETSLNILYYVRLPRVIASIFSGIALALSGAVVQNVLNNRLASPSIIGVNSGAGLAVTIGMHFGIMGGFKLSVIAFIGAFIAVLIVSLWAKRWGASRGTVILMGVALNSLFSAISDTVITFSPSLALGNFDFKIGDFSSVTYLKIIPAVIIISISSLILLSLYNELDILTLGDEHAKSLGVNTQLYRMIFLILVALLAGSSVSIAGLLSFVGLLVPHAVRRMCGVSRHLLPLSLLFGGGFVSLSDTISRTLFAPYELPVGIIMSVLGAPFFILILIRGHKNA